MWQLLDRRRAFGLYPLSRHIQFPSSMSFACQQLRKHCKTLCYTNLSNIKFMLIPVPMLGCLKNEGSLKPRVSILKWSNLRWCGVLSVLVLGGNLHIFTIRDLKSIYIYIYIESHWWYNPKWFISIHMAVCQNLVPLVNIKIAGKWMFIPLKMVLIGIDPYPYPKSCLLYHFKLSIIHTH